MSLSIVIGASGLVGEHLMHCLDKKGQKVIGTYYQHPMPALSYLDLQDKKSVTTLLEQVEPVYVFLPAGLTNVDYCESHPGISYEINVGPICEIVRKVNHLNAKLIFFSTDYIFDGSNGPYVEADPPMPISEYGRQKVYAEHHIAFHASDYLILRTTVVYGWESQGKNFVQRLIHSLGGGEKVRVPVDQIGSPTYAPNLAEAAVELANSGVKGLFHLAGPKLASRYEFAVTAAQVFNLDPTLIEPIPTPELKQTAPRPSRAGMRVDKAQGILKTRLVDYKEGLRTMARQEPRGRSIGT